MKNTLILPGNRSRVSPALVSEGILLGNRIPKDFFVTEGTGQSDITVHAGSYHLALRDAGIDTLSPGRVAVTKGAVYVGTGSVPVELGEVHPAGRRPMAAPDWARGARLVGDERFS